MAGNDGEIEERSQCDSDNRRVGYALKEVARRVVDLEEYDWTEEDELYFQRVIRRVRAKEAEVGEKNWRWKRNLE